MSSSTNQTVGEIDPASVCGIIVSYNGGLNTVAAVEALLPQVGKVLVVDNNSSSDSTSPLQIYEAVPKFQLIRLNVNSGIASALNTGASAAIEAGFTWILTMDQDSLPSPNLVNSMLSFAKSIRDPDAVSFSPYIALQNSSIGHHNHVRLAYAITSGNLVKLSIFEKIGFYKESLFIDSVDFEFSLRLRKHGFSIYQVGDAILAHKLGNMESGFGPFANIEISVHTPVRRYYIIRNHLYLLEEYFFDFPWFILKKTGLIILLILKIIFLEKNKWKNIRMMLHGIRDYYVRKTGAY